ncbi:MAG TPA: PhzF family phenazine biosynthesis protein [Clostridiales bacterium]|nr:PhzF family phenazine biosynthesis protein [Clostridiales bacterium]
MKFFIADAFTDQLFGGNPAGVVLIPEGEDFLPEETMRKTAAELRYSETAFIRTLSENRFHLRYFTPAAEVDLCGHATIASFCVLQREGLIESGKPCTAHTLAGDLEIQLSPDSVLMDMGEAKTFGLIDQPDKLKELYGVMGLAAEVPSAGGQALYPERVSTGLTDIMLAVKDEETLAAIRPDFAALSALSEAYGVTGVHAFTAPDPSGKVHCRNFAPLYDIDEEAATGTSNGALTYYLYQKGLLRPGAENLFIQGEAMDRPSKILSRLTEETGGLRIQVGGSAVILAKGSINL